MRIDVSSILGAPGESIAFDESAAREGPDDVLNGPSDSDAQIMGVRAKGVATCVSDGIYVAATAEGTMGLCCSRCLVPFRQVFSVNCEGKFVERPSETEEDDDDGIEVFLLDGRYCDLDDMIRAEALLSAPMKPLCTEDCKGLCPVCGKSLNLGDCDCRVAPPEPAGERGN